MSITYPLCMCVCVALVIQHAMRMRSIILTAVVCLAVPYFFPRYLIKGTIFGEKKLLEIKHVLIFTTNLV